MKKVRFLLLSILTIMLMTFAMGCETAGDNCKTDDDCNGEKEACYAGYCGENEPAGIVNLKFNLRNSETNDALHCSEANVDNVDITVSVHGDEVAKTTVACKDLNVHELESTNMGYPIEHLWSNKDYDFTVKFTDEVSKNFVAVPKIGGVEAPGAANDANVVKLEKVQQAILTVKWDIDDGYGGTLTECGDISSFRIALNELEACDSEGVCDFTDYTTIPCTDAWMKAYTIHEANVGMSLNIYATQLTDTGVKVLYQDLEKDFKVSQAQLDSGAFERTFTLKALGNKK